MIKSSHAFTLVEVLVVVAILGTLTALFVPALGKMREHSDRVTCASNMRQLGIGLHQYAQENNGALPLSRSPDPLGGGDVSWFILIQRILDVPFPQPGDKSVFICPAAREFYSVPPYRTYGLNLAGGSPTANPPRLLTLSKPSQSALVVEMRHESGGSGFSALSGNVNGVGGKSRLQSRHTEKMNILMADGSLQLLPADYPELNQILLNIRE